MIRCCAKNRSSVKPRCGRYLQCCNALEAFESDSRVYDVYKFVRKTCVASRRCTSWRCKLTSVTSLQNGPNKRYRHTNHTITTRVTYLFFRLFFRLVIGRCFPLLFFAFLFLQNLPWSLFGRLFDLNATKVQSITISSVHMDSRIQSYPTTTVNQSKPVSQSKSGKVELSCRWELYLPVYVLPWFSVAAALRLRHPFRLHLATGSKLLSPSILFCCAPRKW